MPLCIIPDQSLINPCSILTQSLLKLCSCSYSVEDRNSKMQHTSVAFFAILIWIQVNFTYAGFLCGLAAKKCICANGVADCEELSFTDIPDFETETLAGLTEILLKRNFIECSEIQSFIKENVNIQVSSDCQDDDETQDDDDDGYSDQDQKDVNEISITGSLVITGFTTFAISAIFSLGVILIWTKVCEILYNYLFKMFLHVVYFFLNQIFKMLSQTIVQCMIQCA